MAVRDSAYNPPVELPSSSASNFFEEASAGNLGENLENCNRYTMLYPLKCNRIVMARMVMKKTTVTTFKYVVAGPEPAGSEVV